MTIADLKNIIQWAESFDLPLTTPIALSCDAEGNEYHEADEWDYEGKYVVFWPSHEVVEF